MWTLAKVLLVSSLFSLLLFGTYGKEYSELSITNSNTEVSKTVGHESIPLETGGKLVEENKGTVKSSTSNPSVLDPLNEKHAKETFSSDWSTDNSSRIITAASTLSTSPPLIHSFVSKLPLNSSDRDEHSLPVSVPANATSPSVPSEMFTSPMTTLTRNHTDNSSMTVSIQPPVPTTRSVTPLIVEPTTWLPTTNDSFAGFTPYPEKTTAQPTVKFMNTSKILSNTADPQEENRNTGVVFGAILGAILGASLLSLVGYLLCGRRKTDSFSHQRLYDDRNEPVLRLDNAPEPCDVSFGNSSYYNPSVLDSSMTMGRERAQEGIPMDDIPPLRISV
ncbi:mucin-15 [Echinops telfairi]|uniref:Mucin-15 n=2 Tax=Echinops telfairi TaxID=9371 RepID=A0ABM0IUU4_ECHTE|nr:mucin-15 [Echinops telfairi]XP_045146971.1 mucin-15 [Echinops telfairi]